MSSERIDFASDMVNSNFALRQEPFGYTFFDKQKLRHVFLHEPDLDGFLRDRQISAKQVEFLKFKRKDYRRDILYSPLRVYYELTLGCNLHCRYCYNSSGKCRPNELSTAEVLKSLDDFKACNVFDIRFTGGELTCRKDWFEILNYAKGRGFAVSCNTNAAYCDPKVNEQFAKLNLEQVTVSLDGDKAGHEMNRGKGTFDRTIENIKDMHSMGVKLRINTLVSAYSAGDVEKVLEIAAKYAEEINFFTIIFIGRGFHLESANGISLKDHYEMSKKIRALRSKYPNLRILHFSEVTKKTEVNTELGEEFGLKVGLPSGSTRFNVLSDGSYCCGGYTRYIDDGLIMGNVRSDDLFDVWQKNHLLERMRGEGGDLIRFCEKCPKFIDGTCQGPKYETELIRLLHPEVKNPTCIYGDGPSLLTRLGNDSR